MKSGPWNSELVSRKSIEHTYDLMRKGGRSREEIVLVALDLRTSGGRGMLRHFPRARVSGGAPTCVFGMTRAQVRPLTDLLNITAEIAANAPPPAIPLITIGDLAEVFPWAPLAVDKEKMRHYAMFTYIQEAPSIGKWVLHVEAVDFPSLEGFNPRSPQFVDKLIDGLLARSAVRKTPDTQASMMFFATAEERDAAVKDAEATCG